MILKLIKASAAAIALLAVPFAAEAADVPIKAPFYKGAPRSVVSYYNWTGFYIGVNGGYGFGTSTWDFTPALDVKPKGFLLGGTLGYNWQAGSFVYGLEGDFDWSNMKGSSPCIFSLVTCQTSSTWLATARGRIGYAFDRFLPYVTGGAAYGDIKAEIPEAALSATKSKLGWTVGAGLEYAFLGNWTVKAEYLYVDLGSFDTGFAMPTPFTVGLKENIVRAGLNYKFSGPIFSRF